jgi:hypothetical protein
MLNISTATHKIIKKKQKYRFFTKKRKGLYALHIITSIKQIKTSINYSFKRQVN